MKFYYFTLIAAIFINLAIANHIPYDRVTQSVGAYQKSSETITSCGDDNDLIKIDSFELTPDPPVKGKSLHIEAKGSLKKDVEQGSYLTIRVMYGFIKFSEQKLDLCDEAKQINLNCPLKEGPLSISKDTDIPGYIRKLASDIRTLPSLIISLLKTLIMFVAGGKYTIEVNLFSSSHERLTCLHGKLKFPGLFGI